MIIALLHGTPNRGLQIIRSCLLFGLLTVVNPGRKETWGVTWQFLQLIVRAKVIYLVSLLNDIF